METSEPVQSHRKVTVSSNRSFGLVFASVFSVVGLVPLVFHAERPRWWALVIAVAFGAAALRAPQWLNTLNRLWMRLGEAMHRIVNPIIMGLMYYGAVVPTGLLLRAFGKDLLRLKKDPDATTYWIVRETPKKGSMSKQF
jgi:hypothetical protein